MLRNCLKIVAFAAPAAALAAAPSAGHSAQVHLAGDVFVERMERAPGGRTARVLEHADDLHPGDRLVFVVSWSGAARTGLTLTNPVPRSVVWQPAGSDSGEEVSVDGGRNWGPLDTLLVHDAGGLRRALPGDVTHIRWRAGGGAGQVTYRGVVR